MYSYGYGPGFNDPNTQRIFLEQQKQQLEREYDQAQKNIQGLQQRYGLICAQIKALDSFQAQPAPAQSQPDLGSLLGIPGLTPDKLQSAFASPDGQALCKLVSDEVQNILRRQSGAQPGTIPN